MLFFISLEYYKICITIKLQCRAQKYLKRGKKMKTLNHRTLIFAIYQKCLKKQYNTILLQELTSADSDH